MISAATDFCAYEHHRKTDLVSLAHGLAASTVNEATLFPVPSLASTASAGHDWPGNKASRSSDQFCAPTKWTRELEAKFNRLARRQALNELGLAARVEFEKLSTLRRQLKNPRTGEEVIAEYEQRMLTRDLVNALSKYVNWHKQYASDHSRHAPEKKVHGPHL